MGIDPALRRASALVYVEDLESPSLSQQDSHHLAGVLRLRPGEVVVVADGDCRYRTCSVSGKEAAQTFRLEVAGPVQNLEPPRPEVIVGLSLAKGDRTDWAVQKLSELGVDRIMPLICDRTVVRPDDAAAGTRHRRLLRVAREASMQARRVRIAEVAPITGFEQALSAIFVRHPRAEVSLADPGGGSLVPLPEKGAAVLLVGPEGGWSEAELSSGGKLVSLGETVQRTETAAVAGAALLVSLRANLVSPGWASPPRVAKG